MQADVRVALIYLLMKFTSGRGSFVPFILSKPYNFLSRIFYMLVLVLFLSQAFFLPSHETIEHACIDNRKCRTSIDIPYQLIQSISRRLRPSLTIL